MNQNEMLIDIAHVCLAPYADDAKVRDILHVLADHGYVTVEDYHRKCAEVETRLVKESEERTCKRYQ